ncbi:DUF4190 domain-containing protein [Agrococcus terreus]|uniref:DUF4190 domain-containing protein n=1 Tax=Agrococcus terreus TaxID=574649 RepID=UPI00384BEDF6
MSASWQPGPQEAGQQAAAQHVPGPPMPAQAPPPQQGWGQVGPTHVGWQHGAPVAPPQGWQRPQQAAPRWSSPTHPGPRTDLLAVLAIIASATGTTVLLGLGSIAGIVLGAIALGRIRRSGEDGRLLAIWAIALGGATIVGIVSMAVTGVSLFTRLIEQLGPTLGV